MEYLKLLITNHTLLAAVYAWAISQVIKFVINIIVEKKVDFTRFFGDGGMPSTHSATVTSLATMAAYQAGLGSVEFALAIIFAIVVMRDAVGVRYETGKQAASIKELANAINKVVLDSDDKVRTENLKVLVGHTPLQVFFGACLGALVAIVYALILHFVF